jgi:hypothetical protein
MPMISSLDWRGGIPHVLEAGLECTTNACAVGALRLSAAMSCLRELIRRRLVHPTREEVSPCRREPGFLSFPNGLLDFLALTNRIETLTHRDGYGPARRPRFGFDSSSECISTDAGRASVFSLPG